MKCQSKISVSVSNPIGGVDHILKVGSMYECDLAPTIYDAMTFQPSKPSYVVKCEDGMFRRYDAEHFRDIQEVREDKLKELGI
jgi:hypothetical protein